MIEGLKEIEEDRQRMLQRRGRPALAIMAQDIRNMLGWGWTTSLKTVWLFSSHNAKMYSTDKKL